jgi:spore photoproduct lyase family protein
MPNTDTTATRVERLLDIKQIYYELAVPSFRRGKEILARFPDVERIEVASHWNISELHGNPDAAEDWLKNKREILVLGVRKSFPVRLNGRSADYIASSVASGCAMACSYCYVPRRKGYANPISTFVNIDQICNAIERHAVKQGPKLEPNQVDPHYWVYDIGENSDCSVDAAISDNIKDLVELFRRLPNAKASFATKFVNRDLMQLDPQGKTRIRFSLLPASIARIVDIRTTPIAERIAAVNDFVDAGYEVHLNFSPVIYYEDWRSDYSTLFEQVDDMLSPRAKQQIKAEVIFLTHNEQLHEVNLRWHPRAEELLWRPDLQEDKVSEMGGKNVRYRHGWKGKLVSTFRELLDARLPYCPIRYAF